MIRLKHEYKGKEGYLMSVAEDVLEYLKEYHNSETKAIKSRGLCELFNLQNRQVRHLVSGLRRKDLLSVALIAGIGIQRIERILIVQLTASQIR